MRKKNVKWLLTLFVFVMVLGVSEIASAQEMAEDKNAEEMVAPMGRKFCRGITNMATGWVELVPRQFIYSYQEDGPWLFVPYGIARGLGMTVVRTMTGVFETVTFYVPVDGSYDCILDPSYVWQEASD